MTKPKVLRDHILRERGIVIKRKSVDGHAKLIADKDGYKTPMMRLLELHYGEPITKLLVGGTVRKIAERLGITYSTVAKWQSMLRNLKLMPPVPPILKLKPNSDEWDAIRQGG